jgi:hypothetical protein
VDDRVSVAVTCTPVGAVAMEVSSHGLALHRIDGTSFRVGVFTNLARDHLDFHPDVDAYFAAKARLFDPRHCAAAAIGIDDEFGRRLAATVTVPRLTFSSRTTAADIHASRVRAGGTTFTLHGAGDRESVRLRLLGVHQVDNALAATSALAVRGVDLDTAIAGIENLDTIPGRLEAVDAGQPAGSSPSSGRPVSATPASAPRSARRRPVSPTSLSSPTRARTPRTRSACGRTSRAECAAAAMRTYWSSPTAPRRRSRSPHRAMSW